MTITVLGSTGSIGVQTLEVAAAAGEWANGGIEVAGLAAFRNVELLAQQVRQTGAKYACIADESRYNDLKTALADTDVKILAGINGLCELAAIKTDRVVNAIVGMAGLLPTEAAIKSGNALALANKETLVAGGNYIMSLARAYHVSVIPVDSEHSAIFQCLQGQSLQGNRNSAIEKIILTCSGGAFFGMKRAELENITPAKIHNPNWVMGAKVTLDSATLANKGLEFIEAARLFDVTAEQIEVVIHRESILHSAVEYRDGAVIAELGAPDMRLPIQYALTYPERLPCPAKKLSLSDIGKLTFYKPDYDTFTALPAFIKALRKGGAYPTYANAANEAAGALFLAGKIPFTQIGELISEAVENLPPASADSSADSSADNITDIITADNIAREYVNRKFNI